MNMHGTPPVAMGTLTVTTKGQITLKQELLRHMGVRPGQKISVDKLPDGRAILQAERAASTDMDAVFGILKPKNTQQITLSIDEMNDITRQGWAGEISAGHDDENHR